MRGVLGAAVGGVRARGEGPGRGAAPAHQEDARAHEAGRRATQVIRRYTDDWAGGAMMSNN